MTTLEEALDDAERIEGMVLPNGYNNGALRDAAQSIRDLAHQVERLEAQRKQLREALLCSAAAFEGYKIDEILSDYGIATAQLVDIARATLKATE